MANLVTRYSERLVFTQGLVELRPSARALGFALVLFDAVTGLNELVGVYGDPAEEQADQDHADRTGDVGALRRHTTVRLSGRTTVPYRKSPASTFLFFGDFPPATHVVEVRSPYYVARDIPVVHPPPDLSWPAFPDVTLADEDLPLDSPLQPAAYRALRALATLGPSTRYPFSATATLIRGTVRTAGQPLANATVSRAGGSETYVTAGDGEFVLVLRDVPGTGAAMTIDVTHLAHAPASVPVQALRGMTVLRDITMV